jgi:hypothetical protein
MKQSKLILLLAMVILSCWQAAGQIYDTNNEVVSTFAGFGIRGYVDGSGQMTAFSSPNQIVSDTASNLYVWDSGNNLIRKLTPDATVSTLAGGGSFFEGYGTNVSLAWRTAGSMAMDHSNTLWLVLIDGYSGNSYLLTIGTNGYVAFENGGLTNLGISRGICFDSANSLYYSGGEPNLPLQTEQWIGAGHCRLRDIWKLRWTGAALLGLQQPDGTGVRPSRQYLRLGRWKCHSSQN